MFSNQEHIYALVTPDNNIVVKAIKNYEILWSFETPYSKKIKQICCYMPSSKNCCGIFVTVISNDGDLTIFQLNSRGFCWKEITQIKKVKKCLTTHMLTEDGTLYYLSSGWYKRVNMPDKIVQITKGNPETSVFYPNTSADCDEKFVMEKHAEEIIAIDSKNQGWVCDIYGRTTPIFGKQPDGAKMYSGCLVDSDGRIWTVKKGIYEEVMSGQQVEFDNIVDVHYNGSDVGVLDNQNVLHWYKHCRDVHQVVSVTNLSSL